jgi:hypothetical protein
MLLPGLTETVKGIACTEVALPEVSAGLASAVCRGNIEKCAFQKSELKVVGRGQRTRIGTEPSVQGCGGQGEVRAPEVNFYGKEERIGLAGGEGIDFSPNRGQHAGNEAGGRS